MSNPNSISHANTCFHLCILQFCFEGSACLQSLLIRSSNSTHCGPRGVLNVSSGSSAYIYDSVVEEGGLKAGVLVRGNGSKLKALNTSLRSSEEVGLVVDHVAQAVLKSCRSDGGGCQIQWVVKGKESSLTAHDCSARSSGFDNAVFSHGATARLVRCSLDNSQGHGLWACSSGTIVAADATSFSGSKRSNVFAHSGAAVKLSGCRMNKGKSFGMTARGQGTTIIADATCEVKGNGQGEFCEREGGRVVWPRAPSGSCCCVS